MLRQTVCHFELSATDLERASLFYHTLLNWTITSSNADLLQFRSPDGLAGSIRRVDDVSPSQIPLLRIEVDEYAPLLDLAAKLDGGYSGFIDPIQGEWAVHLRDPDGNLIRLARTSASASSRPESAQSGEVSDTASVEEVTTDLPTSPARSQPRPVRTRLAGPTHNRSPILDGDPPTTDNGFSVKNLDADSQ